MPRLKPEFENYYRKLIAENPDKREDIATGAAEIHRTAHPVLFPTLDELSAKGAEVRQASQPGYVKTFAQGVARGTEGLASGVGALTRWGGEVVGNETIAEVGKETSDYWKKAASEGWEKADTDTFQGSFMENPSLKRAVGIVGEAAPSMVAGMGAGGAAIKAGLSATKAALASGTALGALEGAGTYEEAREKGKSVGEASLYGGLATATTAGFEAIGLLKIFKAVGSPIKKAITGAIAEGGTEAAQTIAQNLIAKYGYDKSREWTQGIAEAIIGGAGVGGPSAVVFGDGDSKPKLDPNHPNIQKAVEEGMDPRDIAEVANNAEDDISKYTEHITAKAPKDMFDSTGVKGEGVQEVVETPAGNTGQVSVDEVSPFFGEKTQDQLFMEQPIESGILPAEESASVFEQGLKRQDQADKYMEDLRQSPQGAELLSGQLAEEQVAGEEWMQAPIESGVLPAEESAAAFEQDEAQRTRLADMTQEEQFAEARTKIEQAKKPKQAKGSKARTVKGTIKANGGINFGNFKGELRNMPTSVKYLSSSKGTPIDAMEKTLKEEGWMLPEESLIDKLRDDPEFLRRQHLSKEVSDKPQIEKTDQELQIEEEMAYEPEAPPEGEYKTEYADDLEDGAEITVIHSKGAEGWGKYKVERLENGSVMLGDVELTPFDEVEVLQEKKAEVKDDSPKRFAIRHFPLNSPIEVSPQIISDDLGIKKAEMTIERIISKGTDIEETSLRIRNAGYVFGVHGGHITDKFIEQRLSGETNQTFSDWRNNKTEKSIPVAEKKFPEPKKDLSKISRKDMTSEERRAWAKELTRVNKEIKEKASKEKMPVIYRTYEWNGKKQTSGVLIHKSTKQPGKWQSTNWDERGFSGDTTHNTKEEAIDQAVSSGNEIVDKAEFNRISKTKEFQQGNEDAAENQKWNREQMEKRDAKKKLAIETEIHEAATSPKNNLPEPSQAQKEAGNYKKGHVKISGLDIAVENPEGSTRSGVSEDGKKWSTKMKSHYGYFKRTEGKDGDQVDTFIKPGTEDVQKVFVVDQLDDKGGFDEHKIILGVNTKIQARKEYLKNYDKGWKVGPVTEMSIEDFKVWLGDAKKVKLPVNKEFFKGKVSAKIEATKPKQTKEPWEMSLDEYYKTVDIKDPLKKQEANKEHSKSVAKAKRDGKKVSQENLKRWGLQEADDPQSRAMEKYFEKLNKEESKAEKVSLDEKIPKPEKIEDFGEKIGGAKKDYASSLKDARDLETVSTPFAKTFPEPKYQNLIDAGTDSYTVSAVRAMRDEIPLKPRRKYAVKPWAQQVEFLRGFAEGLLDGTLPIADFKKALQENKTLSDTINSRAELYEIVGHDKSLKGIKISKEFWSMYKGDKNVTKWQVTKKGGKSSAFSNMPNILAEGDTKQEAIDDFIKKYESLKDEPKGKKKVKFNVYQYRATPGIHWIGKKVGRDYIDLKSFDNVKDARSYLSDNYDNLISQLEKHKYIPDVRRKSNEERIGEDHRKGKDITPEEFSGSFGFRGVEFGNWLGKTDERQNALNNAYDALYDLAGILDIPTQAISLNGELGLAFGARGSGGKNAAAAHYEPGKVVINLTRKQGAGSLAHEWYHALDNYFSRSRKQPDKFLSDYPHKRTTNASDEIRQEMIDAFKKIKNAYDATGIKDRAAKLDTKRTKSYWKTDVEIAARVFETYIISSLDSKGFTNDYLANIVSKDEFIADLADNMGDPNFKAEDYYPYLTDKEAVDVNKAFDNFFKVIETKQTDKGTALYSTEDINKISNSIEKCVVCDKLRTTEEGELFWQEMMNTRQKISEKEFLKNSKVSDILDEDETWKQYRKDLSDEVEFYKSENGAYFFQTAGFEFIWKKGDDKVLYSQEGQKTSSKQTESKPVTKESLQAIPYVTKVTGKDGKYRIHFKNNISIPLKTVKLTDEGAFVFTPTGKKLIRGKFTQGDSIEITEAGDIRTVAHENLHFFESIGLISGKDLRLLNRAGEKMFGMGEDMAELRAKYFEAVSKTAKPDSLVGKILAKIKDFVTGMRQVFGRTAGGVIKDIETGKIFDNKNIKKDMLPKTTIPAYSEAADKWYSQMSKVIGEKLPGKGTGKNYLNTIQSWANKGQFKQEELSWSGLEEFLGSKDNFTKDEVVNFLDENRVVIEEVEKGEEFKTPFTEKEAERFNYLLNIPGGVWSNSAGDYINQRERTQEEQREYEDLEKRHDLELEKTDPTKYKQYQIPGGKNYKELLLTLPTVKKSFTDYAQTKGISEDKAMRYLKNEFEDAGLEKIYKEWSNIKIGQYKSSHWEEPNVLAHVRFSEREVDGKKVLHIEELQSDWHQEGRKKGYRAGEGVINKDSSSQRMFGKDYAELNQEDKTMIDNYLVEYGGPTVDESQQVPQAPWKKTWPIKTFQSMVRYATENGFDTIAWTPGEIQADRYDLSKQVDGIDVAKRDDGLYNIQITKDGNLMDDRNISANDMPDYIGKDLAQKIVDNKEVDAGIVTNFSGLDLKVGGEGMKGFYDQILPKEVNKFFNKKAWGKAKVGEIEIEVDGTDRYTISQYFDIWNTFDENGLVVGPDYNTKEEAQSVADELNSKGDIKLHSLEITPEMKSKSLSEGMPQFSTEPVRKEISSSKKVEAKPSFQDTVSEITEDDYTENLESSKNIKGNTASNLRKFKKDVQQGLDKYLGALSTRLGNINPKLKRKMRKLSFDTDKKSSEDMQRVKPMLDKVKKNMTPEDTASWDYARKNSHMPKINKLIKKYDLENEYQAYRDTLDNIRKEALDVGLDVGYIEEYAPRVLKDSKGFLEAIGREGDWPVISRKIQERAKEMGIEVSDMNPDQKADIISGMLYGGNYGLGGVPATKERKLKKIPANLNKFYMSSDGALVSHIHSMRKAIEARKFFGKVPALVAVAKRKLNAAQKEIATFDETTEKRNKEILLKIDNLESKKQLSDKQTSDLKRLNNALLYFQKKRSERLQDVKDNLYEYEQKINRYKTQRDFSENIGTYVNDLIEKGEISAKDEQSLIEMLTARFNEAGTRGVIQAYKNLSYIDTMGSPTSAITQIGDLAWSAYEAGIVPTLKNAYKAAIGKSRITKEDVGVERIAQEFADAGTLGKAVSTVFKMVGLEKMDSIGKESLLNSAYEKYQKRANKNPEQLKKEISEIFEGETDSVIADLQNDNITDNVKLLVYNRLLDFQPVALSEMPQKYLTAGNGRIFYMLKSFTLKQFDVFRNEVYKDLKSKDPKTKIKAMKNFVRLSAFFVLANAGADELKDLILGRKTDLDDRIVDNMLRLGGISKFVTWKARTEGVGSAAIRQILPPFKFIDALTKDIVKAGDGKGLETLASLPVVGKLAYWHMGRGVEKRGDLWNRRLNKLNNELKDVQQGYEETADRRTYLKEHREDLADYRKIKNFKKKINRLKRRINKLKKLTQTESRKKVIIKLEKKRIDMIKEYLKENKK